MKALQVTHELFVLLPGLWENRSYSDPKFSTSWNAAPYTRPTSGKSANWEGLICRDCAHITRNFHCDRCGAEAHLLGRRLCERCTLTDRLTALLEDGTDYPNPHLITLARPA